MAERREQQGRGWERQRPDYERERRGYEQDYGRESREWEQGRPDYEQERRGYEQDYGREGRERQGQGYNPEYGREGRERQGYNPGYGREGREWERGSQSQDWGRQGYGRQEEGSMRGQYAGRGPKGYSRSDERIREDVCDRLADHPQIDASEIEVEVKNAEVTLKGTVDDRNAKRMAEDVAEAVSGVKEVHNQIRVTQGQHNGRTQTTQQGRTGQAVG